VSMTGSGASKFGLNGTESEARVVVGAEATTVAKESTAVVEATSVEATEVDGGGVVVSPMRVSNR